MSTKNDLHDTTGSATAPSSATPPAGTASTSANATPTTSASSATAASTPANAPTAPAPASDDWTVDAPVQRQPTPPPLPAPPPLSPPAPRPINVVLYTRVSTEDQSVDAQLIELRPWVQARGWCIIGEYTDVMSGTLGRRPGLDRMLARAKRGRVDIVIVSKLDRLGRSIINVVELVRQLAARGVAVICTTQGIDTRASNPAGRMMLGMMAVFAEFERDLIRERTISGLKAAVMRGKLLGRPMTRGAAKSRDYPEIVAAWRNLGKRQGLRGLARMLGGVSPMTARRILKDVDDKIGQAAA